MSNTVRIPKPTKPRTGQAVVRLNGKDYYLGKYGPAEAKANYEALIARWLANGRQLPDPESGLTVNDVILAYVRFAQGYYKTDGSTTSEIRCIKNALRPVKYLFGRTPGAELVRSD